MLADCITIFLQKRSGWLAIYNWSCMCPRNRKVSKFQVLRYRDRTRNRWRTTKVEYLMCSPLSKQMCTPTEDAWRWLSHSVTITFQRANFIWGFRYFKRQSHESSQNVHSERKKIVVWKTKSGISINPNISIVNLYHMCWPS